MAALELEWAFGINSSIPNCVHSLQNNNKNEEIIFYPVSNNGVIYNIHTKKQLFLSLHTNIITSSIISSDKKLLILGDSGASNNSSKISIWNASTYRLLSQYELPSNFGVKSLTINKKTNLLSAIINESVNNDIVQHLIIWSLTKKYTTFDDCENSEIDQEITEFKLLSQHKIENKANDSELHHFIAFNQDSSEIVTHGKNINNFIFWSLIYSQNNDSEIKLNPYCTQLTDNVHNIDLSAIGDLTASSFLAISDGSLITATNCGDLIVWQFKDKVLSHRIISKVINKITRGSINCISVLDNNDIIMLASSSSSGCVCFYDFEFRAIGCLNYLGGEVNSISFPLNISKYGDISSVNNKFSVPNMIIATKKNKIIKYWQATGTHDVIMDTFNSICTAMSCHPILPIMAVGNGNSEIQIWDIMEKKIIKNITLSTPQIITDIIFSPNGKYLMFATDRDYLRIYDTNKFEEIQFFKTSYLSANICNLSFSMNGEWIAFCQSNRISVYKKKQNADQEWILIGNYKSHEKDIKCIHFSDDSNKNVRLFSICNENLINEYNLHASNANIGLRIKYTFHSKHNSSPTCIQFMAENDSLILFDDELKLHFYHSLPEQKEEIEPLAFYKSVAGPAFGAPIKKIIALDNNMKRFLFCTMDKVIGLMQGPFNGNPQRYFGCISHPGNINRFEIILMNNEKYLITNGGSDKSMLIWKINEDVLNKQIIDCDEENNLNQIFANLLDTKEYEEICDYFTYAQIENEGEISTVSASISNQIDIKQIISIFQALGCFLTLSDIERIRKEIIYRFGEKINLNEFIQLYVNYKSIYEISLDALHESFETVMAGNNNCENFMKILQRKGDKMSRDELVHCFQSLTGYNRHQLNDTMPKKINVQFFTQQMLGLKKSIL